MAEEQYTKRLWVCEKLADDIDGSFKCLYDRVAQTYIARKHSIASFSC